MHKRTALPEEEPRPENSTSSDGVNKWPRRHRITVETTLDLYRSGGTSRRHRSHLPHLEEARKRAMAAYWDYLESLGYEGDSIVVSTFSYDHPGRTKTIHRSRSRKTKRVQPEPKPETPE